MNVRQAAVAPVVANRELCVVDPEQAKIAVGPSAFSPGFFVGIIDFSHGDGAIDYIRRSVDEASANGYWSVADDAGKEWQVFMLTLQSEHWGRTPGGKWHRVR